MKIEEAHTTASAAQEMALLIRGHNAGQRIAGTDVLKALARMLTGDASTSTDALALLTAARTLMALPLADVPAPEVSDEGLVLHCINELIIKAVLALEKTSGTPGAAFTGEMPALN